MNLAYVARNHPFPFFCNSKPSLVKAVQLRVGSPQLKRPRLGNQSTVPCRTSFHAIFVSLKRPVSSCSPAAGGRIRVRDKTSRKPSNVIFINLSNLPLHFCSTSSFYELLRHLLGSALAPSRAVLSPCRNMYGPPKRKDQDPERQAD